MEIALDESSDSLSDLRVDHYLHDSHTSSGPYYLRPVPIAPPPNVTTSELQDATSSKSILQVMLIITQYAATCNSHVFKHCISFY
jgi:hypothetical protein